MKHIFSILFLVAVFNLNAAGQNPGADSLRQLLAKAPPDSNRVNLLLQTAEAFYFSKPDSSLRYSLQARSLAKDLHLEVAEITALNFAGEASRFVGNYPEALILQFEALELSRKRKNRKGEASSHGFIGLTYIEFGEYRLALQYLLPSSTDNRQMSNKINYTFGLTNIGHAYDLLNMPDSALYYQLKAAESYVGLKHGPLKSLSLTRLGNAYAHKGQPDSALAIYHRALANCFLVNDKVNIGKIQVKIASLYSEQKKYDSSIKYARLAYTNANLSKQRSEVMESGQLLSYLYRQLNNPDSALFYQDISTAMKDSLYGAKKFRQLQHLMLDEQQRQQQAEQQQQQYRNKVKYIILFIVLGVFLLISFLLLRNNRLQKKAKAKVEAAYIELKETQQQLIQREKMASLGELTAGIAHEIQNPLNFVNNFSEVSTELVDEMNIEIEKGNTGDAKRIAQDLKQNLEKINHHGKRAGDIVKGMLQHSRSSSGKKESTNINKLADEYLRLAYHGLRAKDKNFNATLKTDYDESIGNINIIPQDIGRVILNLITNAFYATNEKAKLDFDIYEPIVTVKTFKISQGNGSNERVAISVADNGNGIPQKVLDKIFQPFFTTKPTGQGTGLGLSLSYDIVKAHGGELKVETKEGEGSEFIIQLPV
jgi:two-component system, NtrC family, sensor kinase